MDKGKCLFPDDRLWFPTVIKIGKNYEAETPVLASGVEVDELPTFDAQGLSDLQIHQEAINLTHAANLPIEMLWPPKLVMKIQETWPMLARAIIREKRGHYDQAFGVIWDDFHYVWKKEKSYCNFWDGIHDHPSAELDAFAHSMSSTFGHPHPQIRMHGIIRQSHGHHCGTIALTHLKHILGIPCELTEEEAIAWYDKLRAGQVEGHRQLEAEGTVSSAEPWSLLGSGPPDNSDALIKLLCEKGVPENAAPERAKAVTEKLGNAMVAHALRSTNPWQTLKTAANTPSTRMRLITQEEQRLFVEQKATTRFGVEAQQRKKKFPRQQERRNFTLDPELLQLDAEHFQDENGSKVPQIGFADIGAGQRGIALATSEHAKPFIGDARVISNEALSILLVDLPPDEVLSQAKIEKLRFPAQYKGTDEHIVVFGGILHRGQQKVSRKVQGPNPKPEIIPTSVVKVMIYKGQFEFDWAQFVSSPVKCLIQTIPALTMCQGDTCGSTCGRSHSPVGEQLDAVLL